MSYHTISDSISIVYNLRISNVTRKQLQSAGEKPVNIFFETPFFQWRSYRDCSKQTDIGGLSSYVYSTSSYYFKIDAAVAHVNYTKSPIHFAQTESDDVLLTGGYGHDIGKRGRCAYSVLFGIPTHQDFNIDPVQFGTGHVGLGAQVDGSYHLKEHTTLFVALRLVHFLPRTAPVHIPCAILPYNAYNIKPGNLGDFFIAYQKQWNTHNRIEWGYNATSLFGGSINPFFPEASAIIVLMRHSFFGVYFRNILIDKTMTGITIGLSTGFDSKPKRVGARIQTTLWGSWGIVF